MNVVCYMKERGVTTKWRFIATFHSYSNLWDDVNSSSNPQNEKPMAFNNFVAKVSHVACRIWYPRIGNDMTSCIQNTLFLEFDFKNI